MEEFRKMRRFKQQLSTEETEKILKGCTSGVLAVIGDSGYPYGVPISYVYYGGALYFHSALRGHKIDAIKANSKACFTVIERDDVKPCEYTTYFRSVICFGRVAVIDDAEEKMRLARILGNRYNPGDDEALAKELAKGFKAMCVLKMDIEHITGKESIELVRMRK